MIEGQNPVHAVQGSPIALSDTENTQKPVTGDQYHLVALVGLEVDDCRLQQSDLVLKQGELVMPAARGHSRTPIERGDDGRSARTPDRFLISIAQRSDLSVSVLEHAHQGGQFLNSDRDSSRVYR
ncbi:hypothetical protein [Streptomyces griseosporeus]|uniref:hypothetical protein n=1 Tax=Streptomyces griseosporeus TaxID=1910 RepID=UPI00368E7CA4